MFDTDVKKNEAEESQNQNTAFFVFDVILNSSLQEDNLIWKASIYWEDSSQAQAMLFVQILPVG